MKTSRIAHRTVSKFIIGGNPFSGFSHQGITADEQMKRYYTPERVKATLREAESLGVNTVIARADQRITGILLDYREKGGGIQWFAQTCPELGPPMISVRHAIASGAKGCHIHGGVTDHMLAEGTLAELQREIDALRAAGLAAGIAGHNPCVFEFAHEHLDVDYYMCCYYNPTDRSRRAEHVHGAQETFAEEDRRRVLAVIAGLARPVIHYKILAAGRNDPVQAFAIAAAAMRENDAVCVGIYSEHHSKMLATDVQLLDASLEARQPALT